MYGYFLKRQFQRLFFPNQDTLPRGGFGNLIALPLQKVARNQGNSVFVDEQLQIIEDQWAFLASIKKITQEEVVGLVDEAEAKGRVVGGRLEVIEEENKTPWKPPTPLPIVGELPKTLHLGMSNEIFVEKERLPSALLNRLIRIAAFQNPDFYKAQAMRLPVYDKPRIVGCARDYSHHIGLRRGCFDEVVKLLRELKIKYTLQEELVSGEPLAIDNNEIDRACSVIEAFLFYRLETLSDTKGRFRLNYRLPIPFDGLGEMEVDLICKDARIVIEIDGIQHLSSKECYRSDRRKALMLQEHGYTVLRFLAEDVSKRLDTVLDTILRVLSKQRVS